MPTPKSSPRPVPVSELPLGDYLRWLAAGFPPSGSDTTGAELRRRAKDADALADACDDLVERRTFPSGFMSKTAMARNDRLEKAARDAVAAAKGKPQC